MKPLTIYMICDKINLVIFFIINENYVINHIQFTNKEDYSMNTAIGIDLGTTNTIVSFFINGRPNVLRLSGAEFSVPTCIFFRTAKDYVIGSEASQAGSMYPNAIIRNFKTHINDDVISGKQRYYTVIPQQGGRLEITPKKAVTFFLVKLISMIDEHIRNNNAYREYINNLSSDSLIDNVIITVPTKFEASAKKILEDVAKCSIIHVKCTLEEPTAAAVCSTWEYSQRIGNVLVYDFGGGTFDISVLKHTDNGYVNITELNDGDPNLGGNDITNDILKNLVDKINKVAGHTVILPEMNESISAEEYNVLAVRNKCNVNYTKARENYYTLFNACNNLKHQLSLNRNANEFSISVSPNLGVTDTGAPITQMFTFKYTRKELNNIIENRVNLTKYITENVIENAKLRQVNIDKIIITGGSSQLPMVLDKISDIARNNNMQSPPMGQNFATMVSKGAAIEAASATNISNCKRYDIGFHAFNKSENLCDYFYILYSSDYVYNGERVDITMPVNLLDNRKYLEEIFFYARDPQLHNPGCLTRETSPVSKYYSRVEIPFPDINAFFGTQDVPDSTLCRITVFLDSNYNFTVEQVALNVNGLYKDIGFKYLK